MLGCIDEIDTLNLKDIKVIDGKNHPLDKKNKDIILIMSNLEKAYLRLLKKQETTGQPFYDKLNQLKNFYLPICDRIYNYYSNINRTLIIGLSGGQGSGKSTIAQILKIILQYKFNLNVNFSIDDFYKTSSTRKKMSKSLHPLFQSKRCSRHT